VPTRLTRGTHALEATETESGGQGAASIVCNAGQVTFLEATAEISTVATKSAFGALRYRTGFKQFTFVTSLLPPEDFAGRPMMIYSAGRWLALPDKETAASN
jgi:hypothetical protein